MLQRATTVLGGAASLVRKKSEENALAGRGSSISSGRDKDKSIEEPRSSSGSGGRLTKSPPPGKVSKESSQRDREGSVDGSTVNRASSSGSPSAATHPGRAKASPPPAFIHQPIPRRSITEGGRPVSPLVTRELAKPRNRASILNTFRTWFDDGRRKRKTGSSFSTPNNSPAGALLASPSAPGRTGYFPNDAGYPDRPYTPRKRNSSGKGTGPRRGGSRKDKRHSISSRRSSSVPSRRSSVGSMASIPVPSATLGSVGEYTVYNGVPLTRRQSNGSKKSLGLGAKTPLEEDVFDPSRPGSARSNPQRAPPVSGVGRLGKSHSKSSSTSSGASLGRTRQGSKSNRPPSRSETRSPTNTVSKRHSRVGSGSSQTKVVKQQAKKVPALGNSVAAASETPVLTSKTRHGRSNSVGSMQSVGSSALDEDSEFGRRAASPINRTQRTVHVAQKKQTTYGAPSGSLGYASHRSSWKKSWGQEPPGWATRAATQSVIIEILDTRNLKNGIRDVFAGGGKSGVPPGSTPPEEDDEDDWSDIEDDGMYAGGLGQLGSAHTPNSNHNSGSPNPSHPPDSPIMVFAHSNAGRRTKRVPGGTLALPPANQSGGSPLPLSNPLPVTPTGQPSALGIDGMGINVSRRQLPGSRPGFRGPAIVEEEEEEEE